MEGAPARARPPFVGLTGGIGAGKSEALGALERLGAATLSTDAVTHELVASDDVRDRLVERLGPDVAPGGAVDRSAVASAVFERPEEREWLEGILWPRVGERVLRWRQDEERREPPPAALVVEVPLLFEAGMDHFFDATVAVVAEEGTRERRAAERGHAGLESRTARQLGQDDKAERADFVIENDRDLAALEQAIRDFLAKIGG